MKRFTCLLPAFALVAACQASVPQYMQDMPRSEAETEAVYREIQKELGGGFLVDRAEDIFFVATNAGRVSLDYSCDTAARVAKYLKSDFFEKFPSKPIRIFLFRDKPTYEDYCEKTYGEKPDTPFGFYMSNERKMVMNISTGQGTLAHELVHPLLAEDFPAVPAWFNEGFASLFEQSMYTQDGKMKGMVNWRLPGLQKALRAGEKIPLAALLKTTSTEFYGDGRGLNYAAARYLCLHLQERRLLQKFYKEFKRTHDKDATGRTALESVIGETLDQLQPKWEEWSLNLRWE